MSFHTKSEMNKCQVEGKVNACLYSRLRSSNLSAILDCMKKRMQEKKYIEFFAHLVELNHRWSATKTMVNKIGLNRIFVLFNILLEQVCVIF